jgi:hypothetical protein
MLTDEERKKIYEEEKARLEAREELARKPKTMSKSTSIGCLLLLGLAVLLVVICQLLTNGKTRETPTLAGSSSSSSPPTSDEPELEVISFTWGGTETGHFVEAKGQVKNISGKRLEKVEAVVTFSDKSGGFITSSEALIDYNPILPGQTSPFNVLETYNPAMRTGTATVEFKFLMGGTIPTRHSE